jgi:hypothetical protein
MDITDASFFFFFGQKKKSLKRHMSRAPMVAWLAEKKQI